MRQKPHALTLVFNPNARKPKLRPPSLDSLRARLGPGARLHVTRSLEELDRLMGAWENEDETICFYGGDGSIACGLTALIRHRGEGADLPPVLVVRAGTINMLCSILGVREGVDATLDRWNRNELDALKRIPMIKVEIEGQVPRYGFVFAWGVGYRILRRYYSRRAVPDAMDAVAVVSRAFLKAFLPGSTEDELFRTVDLDLKIEGKSPSSKPLCSLVAGTIPRLSLGIRPFAPEPILPGGFHVSGNGMTMRKVALHAPSLLFQWGDQRELGERIQSEMLCHAGIRELKCVIPEGFTMDGEMFELDRPTKAKISAGPVVRFWIEHNG